MNIKIFCRCSFFLLGRAKDLSAPLYIYIYRGADKSLARPGRKKLQRQMIFMFIYPIYKDLSAPLCVIYIYIYRVLISP